MSIRYGSVGMLINPSVYLQDCAAGIFSSLTILFRGKRQKTNVTSKRKTCSNNRIGLLAYIMFIHVLGCADRERKGILQHLWRLHRSNGGLFAREAVRRERRGQQVWLTPSDNSWWVCRMLHVFILACALSNHVSPLLNRPLSPSLSLLELSLYELVKSFPCHQSSRRSQKGSGCSFW